MSAAVRKRPQAERTIGHYQRYHTRDGVVVRFHRRRDGMVVARPVTWEPDRNLWLEWASLIAQIVVIGGLYIGVLAWVAIAAASTVQP